MKTARTTILNAHSFACFTCPHTREKGVFAFFSSLFVVLSHWHRTATLYTSIDFLKIERQKEEEGVGKEDRRGGPNRRTVPSLAVLRCASCGGRREKFNMRHSCPGRKLGEWQLGLRGRRDGERNETHISSYCGGLEQARGLSFCSRFFPTRNDRKQKLELSHTHSWLQREEREISDSTTQSGESKGQKKTNRSSNARTRRKKQQEISGLKEPFKEKNHEKKLKKNIGMNYCHPLLLHSTHPR